MIMLSRRAALLGGICCLLPTVARAQSGPLDPLYGEILVDRDRRGRVIHLYGDSIARGYGLGIFADQVDQPHPLYELRSIGSTANIVLAENGRKDVFAYGGAAIVEGETTAEVIRERVASGVIRSGDVVVIEDAGKHSCDPGDYADKIADLREAITEQHDITAIFMTMFDYPDGSNLASNPDYQYDLPFGGETINQAIAEAVTEDRDYVGQSRLLDMNARMDQWRSSALAIDGVPVMRPDGIHPNVWGQMRMAGEILKAAGLRPYLSTTESVQTIARVNYQALAYGAAGFTASRAAAYASNCLLR